VLPGNVRWHLNLKATGNAAFHTTMTVSRTPAELLRLASVACVSTARSDRPIVCAAHSDQLPAGAAAAGGTAGRPAANQPGWWYVAGGLFMMLVVLAFVRLVRRRRARHAD
jgi:hypothetical protein